MDTYDDLSGGRFGATMKKNFTIRFSEEEAQWLHEEAEKQRRPISNLIRWIIAKYRTQSSGEGVPNGING